MTAVAATAAASGAGVADSAPLAPAAFLEALAAGAIRAAVPDETAPGGWRVRTDVKAAILGAFADPTSETWEAGPLRFRDRALLAPVGPAADQRIVPGGTAIRAGAHLEPGVIVMPPSYVNVGAWVGRDAMVDSHVLVGSCAQIGARVHLAAGVTIGGVLEPAGARPVIVEDDAFVGAGSILLEGVLVRRGAVIGAGTVLTGTSRLFDVDAEEEMVGTVDEPLVVPEGAVVVPGTRPVAGEWAQARGLAVATALIVKRRDAGTSARVALEAALRG